MTAATRDTPEPQPFGQLPLVGPDRTMAAMTRVRRVLRADDGASAVEYALLLAGIVAVCIVAVFATFRAAGALYDSDCQTVGTNNIAGAPAAC